MSVYAILNGVTATQTVSAVNTQNNPIVQPTLALGITPSPAHAFQITVTAPSGIAVTGTLQPVGSNDGINFVSYGTTAVANGTAPATAGVGGSTPYKYVGAYLTGISGTGAVANATVSA